MDAKELKRFEIFSRVQRKEISLQKAAEGRCCMNQELRNRVST